MSAGFSAGLTAGFDAGPGAGLTEAYDAGSGAGLTAGLHARLIPISEAESAKEEILARMPADVRARTSSCIRKEKALQIAAADYYMRRMGEELGLGTIDTIRVGHLSSGKPYLLSDGERVNCHVSISHSAGFLYLCLSDSPVGCDVERIRCFPANDALKGFFSEADLNAIREAARPGLLLTRIWTRREAYAKLTGITQGQRSRSFHDADAAGREYGISFREGREGEYLFTTALFSDGFV